MLRILLLFAISTTMLTAFAQQEKHSLKGTVLDEETNEPIPFANVTLLQDGKQLMDTTTDFDGKFELKDLSLGKYTLQISYVGYATKRSEITVPDKEYKYFRLKDGVSICDLIEYTSYNIPLIKKEDNTIEKQFSRQEIEHLASF